MTNKVNGNIKIIFDGRISIKYNGTTDRNNVHNNLDITIDGREEVEVGIDEFIDGINNIVGRTNKRRKNKRRYNYNSRTKRIKE